MNVRASSVIAMAVTLLGAACGKTEEDPNGAGQVVERAQPASAAQPSPPPQVTPPSGARVFFVEPSDGAEVKGALVDGKVNVKFKMGAEGIKVQEAGQQVSGTGHHHLIVDGEHIALGAVVPKDDAHVHFGKGQTEAELMLAPGDHTITMQFADGAHLSYGNVLASTIKIKVVADPNPPASKLPAADPK
jgi:hypothetical protein